MFTKRILHVVVIVLVLYLLGDRVLTFFAAHTANSRHSCSLNSPATFPALFA